MWRSRDETVRVLQSGAGHWYSLSLPRHALVVSCVSSWLTGSGSGSRGLFSGRAAPGGFRGTGIFCCGEGLRRRGSPGLGCSGGSRVGRDSASPTSIMRPSHDRTRESGRAEGIPSPLAATLLRAGRCPPVSAALSVGPTGTEVGSVVRTASKMRPSALRRRWGGDNLWELTSVESLSASALGDDLGLLVSGVGPSPARLRGRRPCCSLSKGGEAAVGVVDCPPQLVGLAGSERVAMVECVVCVSLCGPSFFSLFRGEKSAGQADPGCPRQEDDAAGRGINKVQKLYLLKQILRVNLF
jgi:hypothetical protein